MLRALSERDPELVSDAELPAPEVYEQEYAFWPWRSLIDCVQRRVVAQATVGAHMLDCMSGTGFLLRETAGARPDITAMACDIHLPFVDFARKRHRRARTFHADVRVFTPPTRPDVVTCTGGLHHLHDDDQAPFLARVAATCAPEALVIFGEEALPAYNDDAGRRIAALRLNQELLAYGLECAWPQSMIEAAIGVLRNDVLRLGEYKRDVASWRSMICCEFEIVDEQITWDTPPGGCDIVFVCRPRRR